MSAIVFNACRIADNHSSGAVVWVDLGLPSGLLWADRNVGAARPEDGGDYFAWGEAAAKSDYSWATYRHANGDHDQLTRYCTDTDCGYNGFTDSRTILRPMDDAATQALGKGVRTPSKDEWEELMANTTATWATVNGVRGRMLAASNGNRLFLPAAGYRNGTSLNGADSLGLYWSSSLCESQPDYAEFLFFYSGYQYMGNLRYYRYYGQSVRPVRSAR